ncbi:hypothetical protein [Streptomyces sp. TR1341]|uniref:hypothetical protein n=1 Tax=Streptomyces sp. TR1341 TaxID=2601266 RepID=UPI00192EA77F
MVESEQADGAGGRLYAYRVRGAGRSGVVLWVGGRGDDLDRVVSVGEGGRRRVPVFVTGRQARVFAGRRGWRLAASEVGTLELVRVERWLADPVRRRVPAGVVLEAWNLFEDLARGLGEGHRLPRQDAVHGGAYEKLFAGECGDWTPDERRAVRELLTAGVELWESVS